MVSAQWKRIRCLIPRRINGVQCFGKKIWRLKKGGKTVYRLK